MPELTDYTGTWVVDASHSTMGFKVRHAMVTTVNGRFGAFAGTLTLNGAVPGESAATVTIEAASVDTGSAQRDEHLRSADFFDTQTYPELRFVSTSASVSGESFTVTGDLTIRDVTAPVTLHGTLGGVATDPFGNVRAGFEATAAIERRDFGLTWNAALDKGGWLVSERVTITLDVSAIRQG